MKKVLLLIGILILASSAKVYANGIYYFNTYEDADNFCSRKHMCHVAPSQFTNNWVAIILVNDPPPIKGRGD